MQQSLPKAGFAGAVAAFLTSICCILPITMMLLGLGGSWVAVFAKIAVVSPFVAAASVVLLVAGWVLAWRNGAPTRIFGLLGLSSALTAIAIAVILFRARIDDFLISVM